MAPHLVSGIILKHVVILLPLGLSQLNQDTYLNSFRVQLLGRGHQVLTTAIRKEAAARLQWQSSIGTYGVLGEVAIVPKLLLGFSFLICKRVSNGPSRSTWLRAYTVLVTAKETKWLALHS